MATSRKTQEESEQPAKVYQLDALTGQVNSLTSQVEKGFSQLNTNVNTLLIKAETQVTPQQLESNIAAVKTTLREEIDQAVESIHYQYRPLKTNIRWLFVTIGGATIVALVNALVLYVITKGN